MAKKFVKILTFVFYNRKLQKITSNELAELQCAQCDKNGNTECTDCVAMREIIDPAIMQ